MSRRKKQRGKRGQTRPTQSLREVKGRVKQGRVVVLPEAKVRAMKDFNWGVRDITKAVLALKKRDFCKSDDCEAVRGERVDYHKADKLMGEAVYLHFYVCIERGVVVIQSCKRLEK